VLEGKLAAVSKKMTQKAGDDFFFGLHFKFGWRFCKAETPSKKFLDPPLYTYTNMI